MRLYFHCFDSYGQKQNVKGCHLLLSVHKQLDHASLELRLLHSMGQMDLGTEEVVGEILQIHLRDLIEKQRN